MFESMDGQTHGRRLKLTLQAFDSGELKCKKTQMQDSKVHISKEIRRSSKVFITSAPKYMYGYSVTRWTKQAFSDSKFLSPGGQLWANTAFEGSQFYSIGVPKFYSWVNVISVYVHNDLG